MEAEKIQAILNSSEALKKFAERNGLAVGTAQAILLKLLAEPEISEKAKAYIYDDARSDDFKAHNAGHEKGYKQGHEAGFAKGALLGVLASIGTGLAVFFKLKK